MSMYKIFFKKKKKKSIVILNLFIFINLNVCIVFFLMMADGLAAGRVDRTDPVCSFKIKMKFMDASAHIHAHNG